MRISQGEECWAFVEVVGVAANSARVCLTDLARCTTSTTLSLHRTVVLCCRKKVFARALPRPSPFPSVKEFEVACTFAQRCSRQDSTTLWTRYCTKASMQRSGPCKVLSRTGLSACIACRRLRCDELTQYENLKHASWQLAANPR